MKDSDIVVVVPHSGLAIPGEIALAALAEDFSDLACHVDWHTNWLYDFRDINGARPLVFSYCSLILEANRHPGLIDDYVPLDDGPVRYCPDAFVEVYAAELRRLLPEINVTVNASAYPRFTATSARHIRSTPSGGPAPGHRPCFRKPANASTNIPPAARICPPSTACAGHSAQPLQRPCKRSAPTGSHSSAWSIRAIP